MNTLPEEIEYIIYKYKHQLEYKNIIDHIKYIRIKCFFNVNVNILNMVYCNYFNLFVKCLEIDNLCPTAKQILYTIKINKY